MRQGMGQPLEAGKVKEIESSYSFQKATQLYKHTDFSPVSNILFFIFIFFSFKRILFFLIFIGLQLLYNVVLVTTVQQSESAIRIHIIPFLWISFPFRSPQNIEQSSLGYTVSSHFVIYFTYSNNIVYTSIPISQFVPPHPFLLGIHIFVLYFCFADKIIYTIFLDSTYIH